MVKTAVLGLAVVLGSAVAAKAAPFSLLAGPVDGNIILVGEGCGPGAWRSGLDNRCHPFGAYAHGIPAYACPPYWHIGPRRGACWPNR